MEVSGLWFDLDKLLLKSGTFLKLREFRFIVKKIKLFCRSAWCSTLVYDDVFLPAKPFLTKYYNSGIKLKLTF